MHTYEAEEINELYPTLVRDVLTKGTLEVQHNDTSTKPLTTMELHPAIIELSNPLRRLVTATGRPINVPFALAEVLWILGGRNDVEMVSHYNSRIHNYSDDGATFNAAYGHRLRHAFGHDQIMDVVLTLQEDQGSRQAVIGLWHPEKDRGWTKAGMNLRHHVVKDRACNVLSHFMIRGGAMDLSQIVRSNDLLWGTPYNLIQWTHVLEYVAGMVGVPVGRYIHFADSLHIYDWHWDEANRIATAPPFNLYEHLEWDHTELLSGGVEHWLHETLLVEAKLRKTGSLDSVRCAKLPLAWQRILMVLMAHNLFKNKDDHTAFQVLTMGDPDLVYMAATLNFWWSIRWHKGGLWTKHIESLGLPSAVNEWIMVEAEGPG